MPNNASPAAARAGWAIYRASNGTATLTEINEALSAAGYEPVHDRTRRHYRRLFGAGYDHYVSINRFDIALASAPYENTTASNRYPYHSVGTGVRLTFVRNDEYYESFGIASEISEAGALLRFQDLETVTALKASKVRAGNLVLISFLEIDNYLPARIVELDETHNDFLLAEVEFTQLHPVAEYTDRTPLPEAPVKVVAVASNAEASADLIARRIYFLFESLEATRGFLNAVLDATGSSRYIDPPSLERLSVASPLESIIGMPAPLVETFVIVTGGLALFIRAQKARLAKNDADYRAEEVKERRLKNERRELKNQLLKDAVNRAQKDDGLPDSQLDLSQAESILDKQVIPSIEQLAVHGIESISVDPEETQSS
jgi:hypothetical protein